MNEGSSAVSPRLYIAGTGLITSVGPTTAATALAVRAGKTGYQQSSYLSKNGKPITMTEVPAEVFDLLEYELEECDSYNAQYDHTIKMAILALGEACRSQSVAQPIPLILSMPEQESGPCVPLGLLTRNLAEQCSPLVHSALTRACHSGRAAGMEAIAFAFRYLLDSHDYILVGGSDSFCSRERLKILDNANRALTSETADGFAPGEGAAFLLLIPNPELALVRDNSIIALYPPGMADEPGHLYSEQPYRGDGLDQAFKKALADHPDSSIQTIYSSMNGENHWAKEYGVAFLRNKSKFADPIRMEHPADCLGDLGAATAPALIILAADDLWRKQKSYKHLVYSSSDTARRGALVVEKITVNQ